MYKKRARLAFVAVAALFGLYVMVNPPQMQLSAADSAVVQQIEKAPMHSIVTLRDRPDFAIVCGKNNEGHTVLVLDSADVTCHWAGDTASGFVPNHKIGRVIFPDDASYQSTITDITMKRAGIKR